MVLPYLVGTCNLQFKRIPLTIGEKKYSLQFFLNYIFFSSFLGFLKDHFGVYDQGFYCGGVAMIASGIVQGLGGIIHHQQMRRQRT